MAQPRKWNNTSHESAYFGIPTVNYTTGMTEYSNGATETAEPRADGTTRYYENNYPTKDPKIKKNIVSNVAPDGTILSSDTTYFTNQKNKWPFSGMSKVAYRPGDAGYEAMKYTANRGFFGKVWDQLTGKTSKKQEGGSLYQNNLQYIGTQNNIAAYRRADGKIEYYSLNPDFKSHNIPGTVLDDANQQWYKLIYEGKDKNGFAQQNINYNREKENMNPNYNQPEIPNLIANIQTKPALPYTPSKKQGGTLNYLQYVKK